MNPFEHQDNVSFDLSNFEDEEFYKNEDLSGISQKPGETMSVWEHHKKMSALYLWMSKTIWSNEAKFKQEIAVSAQWNELLTMELNELKER